MNLEKLMQMLAPYCDADEKDVQVYDLSTEEGLKGYNEQLDQLENTSLDVLNLFGINGKEWIKGMRDLGQKIYEQNKKKEQKKFDKAQRIVKQAVKQMERKEEDHSDEPEEDENQKFVRPSQNLSIQQKLQLHKIVQEYVDTMIKPFNNGHLTNNQINDAYAGLYEFAAWIMNR